MKRLYKEMHSVTAGTNFFGCPKNGCHPERSEAETKDLLPEAPGIEKSILMPPTIEQFVSERCARNWGVFKRFGTDYERPWSRRNRREFELFLIFCYPFCIPAIAHQ